MKIRDLISISGAVLSLGTVFYLMSQELSDQDDDGRADGIAPTELQATSSATRQDPLQGIEYSQASRRDNFESFGMDESMVEATLKAIGRLDDKANQARLKGILSSEQGDRAFVQSALCSPTNDLRPRYGALQLLVETRGGRDRFVRQIDEIDSHLEAQEWAAASAWSEVYRSVELVGERREADATIMGIAAVLEGMEDSVLEEREPWGAQGTRDWSWEELVEAPEFAGVEEQVVRYFALFHLVAEVAHGDDGICQD